MYNLADTRYTFHKPKPEVQSCFTNQSEIQMLYQIFLPTVINLLRFTVINKPMFSVGEIKHVSNYKG